MADLRSWGIVVSSFLAMLLFGGSIFAQEQPAAATADKPNEAKAAAKNSAKANSEEKENNGGIMNVEIRNGGTLREQ